jgi:hypothetical protein
MVFVMQIVGVLRKIPSRFFFVQALDLRLLQRKSLSFDYAKVRKNHESTNLRHSFLMQTIFFFVFHGGGLRRPEGGLKFKLSEAVSRSLITTQPR